MGPTLKKRISCEPAACARPSTPAKGARAFTVCAGRPAGPTAWITSCRRRRVGAIRTATWFPAAWTATRASETSRPLIFCATSSARAACPPRTSAHAFALSRTWPQASSDHSFPLRRMQKTTEARKSGSPDRAALASALPVTWPPMAVRDGQHLNDGRKLSWNLTSLFAMRELRGDSPANFFPGNCLCSSRVQIRNAPRDLLLPGAFRVVIHCCVQAINQRARQIRAFFLRQAQRLLHYLGGSFGHRLSIPPLSVSGISSPSRVVSHFARDEISFSLQT